MDSAFGIDHGNVEKAFSLPKIKMPKMPGAFKPKTPGVHQAGAPKHAGPAGPKPFGQGGMMQQAQSAMGGGGAHKGVGAVKRTLAKPGVQVGAAGVAGGAGAVGGYQAFKRKKPGQV